MCQGPADTTLCSRAFTEQPTIRLSAYLNAVVLLEMVNNVAGIGSDHTNFVYRFGARCYRHVFTGHALAPTSRVDAPVEPFFSDYLWSKGFFAYSPSTLIGQLNLKVFAHQKSKSGTYLRGDVQAGCELLPVDRQKQ